MQIKLFFTQKRFLKMAWKQVVDAMLAGEPIEFTWEWEGARILSQLSEEDGDKRPVYKATFIPMRWNTENWSNAFIEDEIPFMVVMHYYEGIRADEAWTLQGYRLGVVDKRDNSVRKVSWHVRDSFDEFMGSDPSTLVLDDQFTHLAKQNISIVAHLGDSFVARPKQ